MLRIETAGSPEDVDAVRRLFREYTDWAFTLEGGKDEAPTFANFEAELASLPAPYTPPGGFLLLAKVEGQPAGCIALKGHDAGTSELKRLYVRPGFRGLRVGEQLVAELVARARSLGHERIILDSHRTMTKAHELYRAAGFHDVAAPVDFPDALKPLVVFMEMEL